ncbi:hypothetical protein RFI_10932, partial [Reticulomyxa filosa]
HIRVSSIIASTFSPAELIGTTVLDNDDEEEEEEEEEEEAEAEAERGTQGYGNEQFKRSQNNINQATRLLPKGGVVLHRKRTSLSATNQLTTQFTGPRIIRNASEATSEQSLSYKIPTRVADVWRHVVAQLELSHKTIDEFKGTVVQVMYPIVQLVVNGVVPAVKAMLREPSTSSPDLKPKSHNKDISKLQLESSFNDEKDQESQYSTDSDESHVHKDISLFDFPFINAMYQYCLTEGNLYEYLLAFERLAVEIPFGPVMEGGLSADLLASHGRNSDRTRMRWKPQLGNWNSYTNGGISNASLHFDPANAKYKYMHLLEYNFEVLSKMCSEEFAERMRYIVRVHTMIRRFICEMFYEFVRAFTKCLRLLINYRDTFEKTSLVDEDTV